MPKAKNPLKWRGVDFLTAAGLSVFKLPRKLGGSPVFYLGRSEIVPFFIFTPHLKWGAVSTSGLVGLSFTDVDGFVHSLGKASRRPSFMLHTANFPSKLYRYIDPDEAERGAFKEWAVLINDFLSCYPTSAEELTDQLRDGRLGGFRADQQFTAQPPDEALKLWFSVRGIPIPAAAPLPIQAISTSSTALQ